jgi:hypothetical protein
MLTDVSYMLNQFYEKTVSSQLHHSCNIYISRKQKHQGNVIHVKSRELEQC